MVVTTNVCQEKQRAGKGKRLKSPKTMGWGGGEALDRATGLGTSVPRN